VEENGGHECLLAEAYVPQFDPLTAPMDPVLDRHVGQKNEQLVTLAPGGSFHISLNAANLAPFGQLVTIDVHAVTATTLPPLFARGAAVKERELSPPISQLPLKVTVRPESAGYVAPSDFFPRRLLSFTEAVLSGDDAGSIPFAWISQAYRLDAWESRKVEVSGTVPAGVPSGQTFMFRVLQRTGAVVTGGYSAGVLVA
jgi:hypothetical protein